MGGKRSLTEADASTASHGAEWDGGPPKKRHKTRKQKHKQNPDALNWVKKRARTIDRRLKAGADDLPGGVTSKLQRELAAHSERIQAADDKKQRQKMIKRYHMVRFFGAYPPSYPPLAL